MQSEFGGAMVGGPRAWSEGSLNDFVLDLCFFDLADIDEQPATGDALVEALRTTGPTVSSFDPTELALAGCDQFPNAYVVCQVAAWPGTNERKEDVITEFGWVRAKAAADDAWRSAAAEAVDLGIRKALLVCQDELDDAASDAWGTVTWRPLLYLADAVGIEEELIGSVRSYVLGTRPAVERGGKLPAEANNFWPKTSEGQKNLKQKNLKQAKLDGKVPVDLNFLRYRITSMEDDRCKIQYPGPYKILNLERGGKLPVELKEAKLDAKLPVDLKYRSLDLDYTAELDGNDIVPYVEEDCVIKLRDQGDFDDWTRKSKATLWLKREIDTQIVKQVCSLAEAVQAQEEADSTGTYLFHKHPGDPKSREDWKEFGDSDAEHEAYRVKYHHHVPGDNV